MLHNTVSVMNRLNTTKSAVSLVVYFSVVLAVAVPFPFCARGGMRKLIESVPFSLLTTRANTGRHLDKSTKNQFFFILFVLEIEIGIAKQPFNSYWHKKNISCCKTFDCIAFFNKLKVLIEPSSH